jgi:N-acetylglucosamine-6-phosphate deacetylase
MRLRSERIVTPGGIVAGELTLAGERIVGIGPGGPPDDELIEFGGSWILPGFIDTHVHGGGGAQCNTSDPGELSLLARVHARHGTTALLASTVSAPIDQLTECLRVIARVVARGPQPGEAAILGAHLEGPFISRERPGAMDATSFRDPDPEQLERLLEAGPVRWMTIAPELPGALALIAGLRSHGVIASIGHSDATEQQAREAVAAGASAATHTFNAMRPLHHREPGVLGAVLDLDAVSCELICDGVHVAPAALRLAYRAKGPDRVRLVTDAMAAAGMPDGEYLLGGVEVRVKHGRAVLAASPETIAGSTLTMDGALRGAVAHLGVGVEEAAQMAATNPARMLGIGDRTGALAPGLAANLVILSEDTLEVQATMIAGVWAHRAA